MVFAGAVLCAVAGTAGCSAGADLLEAEKRGYRTDRWYAERHERIVQRVFDRENRVELSREDLRRFREELKQVWLRQQRRRLEARERRAENKTLRREDFIETVAETERAIKKIRAEQEANQARARRHFEETNRKVNRGGLRAAAG